jgi:hypothetical protein
MNSSRGGHRDGAKPNLGVATRRIEKVRIVLPTALGRCWPPRHPGLGQGPEPPVRVAVSAGWPSDTSLEGVQPGLASSV